MDAIKHYIHGSQRLSIESLRDIAKVKDNLEIHLREIETLLKNHDNYASAIATQYAAKPVFTQFMALHSASVIKLFIMLDEDPQSNKIDKKTLASMFPGDNKDAVADLYEWALQLRKSSLNNAKNTEPASIIPFPELVKKMKHTPKEGIEYVKKALISRRKSRLERTINNTGFNYEMFVNFKRTTLHYALQILSSLHKNLKDLIKIDLFLLKESSIRVSSSVDIEGFNSPERIRTLITVLKNKLLNMDLEDGDVKRVCRLVKDYFNQVECLSLRMKKLFTLWRDRDTFSSRLNELFQSEMNVFNEKRAKNLLALVKKNVDNLLSVIQAVKPLFSDPGADSIMNAKVEIANFSKKVKELIRDVQNFEMSAKKAFNSLIIAFEELLGNNDVKNLRMHVTSLEKFVLSNNNKNNRGIDSEKLSIALDVFWETFSTLKDEQTLLASNWALDPVDIFYNKFEIYAAQVRALKINRAEFGSGNFDSEILEMIQIQLGFFVSGSMEMLAMFEQGINIYEQAKILDKNTEEQAFQQDVLEGAPITMLYASFVYGGTSSCGSVFERSKVDQIPIRI